MLAAHPSVVSFPETHFFLRVLSGRRAGRVSGLASRDAGEHLDDVYRKIGRRGAQPDGSLGRFMARQYVNAFVETLDAIARERNASAWVEKTPGHLHAIRWIERYIRGARFIHVVRDGMDVVASLYEVSKSHPDVWGARTVEECAARWLGDIEITRRYLSRRGHTFVRYERLVDQPEAELRRLCDFLGLEFDPLMLERRDHVVAEVVLAGESWKDRTARAVHASHGKFEHVLDDDQQQAVMTYVDSVDLDDLDRLSKLAA